MTPSEYAEKRFEIEQAARSNKDVTHEWNDPSVVLELLYHAEKINLGPTGEKIHGEDDPHDKGGIQVMLSDTEDDGVRVDFGTSLTFIRMRKFEAQQFALALLQRVGLPNQP